MISITDVHKSFGTQKVLEGITLEIPRGQTTAIVGPSGAGKSVLMKLIMGIMKPENGTIKVFNHLISHCNDELKKEQTRAKLGILFQSAALLDSLSVYDNIAFPLKERLRLSKKEIHVRVCELVEALSLENEISFFPQQLSIGTKKRVGLARSLITKPEVVLFDEPNTGLDPLVGQEVYDLIKTTKEMFGYTGIIISHELPEVFQVANKVAMILDGKIIAQGTPMDFINSSNPAVFQFLNGKTDGPIKIK